MVTRRPSLTPAIVANLRQTYANEMQSLQNWTHAPVITLSRLGDATTDTVTCITIRLADRQEENTGIGTATTGTEQTGILKAWATEFSRPPRQGDTFTWNGMVCSVSLDRAEELKDSGVWALNFIARQQNRSV